MVILEKRQNAESNIDCTYNIKSGDLITPITRIGYTTTFNDSEPVLGTDIEDLYIYTCWNEDDNTTLIFISIREDWDLIYVSKKIGNYVGNTDVITSAINAWVNNNQIEM